MGSAYIRSASPDFKKVEAPGRETNYVHGAALRRSPLIPMAFQVTSPFDKRRVLLPHALVLHVNPANFQENFSKRVERIQTRGGFVEQHWPDNLTEISADGSTGAFMNVYTGLASLLRQRTIAWDRFRDLYELYHNNGSIRDPYGNVVLQGQIMLMYDRGTFLGTFRTFSFEEVDESPFAFTLNWTFKVEHVILQIPGARSGAAFYGPKPRVPDFQWQNDFQSDIQTHTSAETPEYTPAQAERIQQGQEEALLTSPDPDLDERAGPALPDIQLGGRTFNARAGVAQRAQAPSTSASRAANRGPRAGTVPTPSKGSGKPSVPTKTASNPPVDLELGEI